MEIVALQREMQDNSKIFELLRDDRHIMYGNMRAIADYTESRVEQITDGRLLKGFLFKFIGHAEFIYEHRNYVGTRKQIRDKFNLNPSKISSYIGREKRINNGLTLNGEHAELITIVEFYEKHYKPEQQSKNSDIEVPKFVYKGENKRYMDYLFNSTFKNWRV